VAKFQALLGLAFDVQRKGGGGNAFQPARFDLGAGKELFAELRLRGFAAALRKDIALTLIIAGGDEGRYKHETPPVNRAEAICEMLLRDGIDAVRVEAWPSRSNTGGNIDIFARKIRESGIAARDFALMTNLYHLPRAQWDMARAGLQEVALVPAESAILYEVPKEELDMQKELLISELGGGPLAERMVEEAAGIADKLRGTYVSRTDAAPANFQPQKA
jgi:hypothetical protein